MEMEWVRGEEIGHGSFGSVNLAIPRKQSHQIPQILAVKTSPVSHSAFLMAEKQILDEVSECPQVIRCLGDSFSFENGEKLYNVLLEYAAGGSIADQLKNYGNRQLPESEVQRHAKSVLSGLDSIHKKGYVHCDIKLQNILLCSSKFGKFDAKIADFGLAKKAGAGKIGPELRGTPLYMAPEIVTEGDQESPADIWALGCLVSEMVTGHSAMRCSPDSNVFKFLMRVANGNESPEIPEKLSKEGKDFLEKCFLRDPQQRWTAEMLLQHPFLAADDSTNFDCDIRTTTTVPVKSDEEAPSTSPRSPFDYLDDWVSSQSSVECPVTFMPSPEYSSKPDNLWFGSESNSPASRMQQLATMGQVPDWSNSGNWVTVR